MVVAVNINASTQKIFQLHEISAQIKKKKQLARVLY
jgi:hypothetical protein